MSLHANLRNFPSLNSLRSFEAAARHNSFLKAAEELNVTPGAISRLVKSLETYLDIELFERYARGVEISSDAREYANAIRQAFEEIDRSTNRLLEKNRQPVLRFCCHPTVAAHWLMPRFADLQIHVPSAQFAISTSLSPEKEDFRNYDFIIRVDIVSTFEESHGIANERLLDIECYPVCSPEYLDRNPGTACLEQISEQQLLHASLRPNDWNLWLESAGTSKRVGQNGQVFESLTHAYHASLAGAGIAIGIHEFVASDVKSGRLTRPLPHIRKSRAGFNILYRSINDSKQSPIYSTLEWFRKQRDLAKKA